MVKLKNPELLKTDSYINGKWIKGSEHFDVINPFDQSVITTVSGINKSLAQEAVESAHKAFASWKALRAEERGSYLKRWSKLIEQNQEDLALILTLEVGKPLEQAHHEFMGCTGILRWAAEEACRLTGYTPSSPDPSRRFLAIKQPVGVIAAITPWNFPSVLPLKKCAPALAVGCTAVLKPAEDTPLSALALAHLAHEAGIPPGVFNVLTCSSPDEVGKEIITHPLVRKVSFTGSTEVGKKIIQQSGSGVKNLTMELGGNCPAIIAKDANIERAAEQTFWFKMYNAGQCCNNINRFLIHTDVYDTFVEKFESMMKEHIRLGPGTEESSSMGPLINTQGMEKVESHVKDALAKGAIARVGGKKSDQGALFFEPTLLVNVKPNMQLYHEETFGPVVACYRFGEDEEAIAMANDTHYGLASYLFTESMSKSWKIAEALEAGSIGVNTCDVVNESLPFGGWKESGIGREGGAIGGLDSFLESKTVVMGGL